jgi:hypothetical protein
MVGEKAGGETKLQKRYTVDFVFILF